MASGILFLIFLIGMVMVVFWSVRNDTVGMKRRTSGLLAMNDAEYAETVADQLKAQQAQHQAQHRARPGTAAQQPGPGNSAPDS